MSRLQMVMYAMPNWIWVWKNSGSGSLYRFKCCNAHTPWISFFGCFFWYMQKRKFKKKITANFPHSRVDQSPINLTHWQDKKNVDFSFVTFRCMRFLVYIVCPSVLNLNENHLVNFTGATFALATHVYTSMHLIGSFTLKRWQKLWTISSQAPHAKKPVKQTQLRIVVT